MNKTNASLFTILYISQNNSSITVTWNCKCECIDNATKEIKKNHLQAEVSIIGHFPVESVVYRLLLLTCFFLVPYVKQFKLSKICQTKWLSNCELRNPPLNACGPASLTISLRVRAQ